MITVCFAISYLCFLFWFHVVSGGCARFHALPGVGRCLVLPSLGKSLWAGGGGNTLPGSLGSCGRGHPLMEAAIPIVSVLCCVYMQYNNLCVVQ
jgi:hypothetical protein